MLSVIQVSIVNRRNAYKLTAMMLFPILIKLITDHDDAKLALSIRSCLHAETHTASWWHDAMSVKCDRRHWGFRRWFLTSCLTMRKLNIKLEGFTTITMSIMLALSANGKIMWSPTQTQGTAQPSIATRLLSSSTHTVLWILIFLDFSIKSSLQIN